MFYDYAFPIPASTAKASPYTRDLHLCAGIVHRIELQFPIGTYALAHCYLVHDGHQWQPSNPDGDFASDGYVIAFDEYYELAENNNIVKFVGWNDDDTFQHTITVRIGILPKDVVQPQQSVTSGLRKLLQMIGIGS